MEYSAEPRSFIPELTLVVLLLINFADATASDPLADTQAPSNPAINSGDKPLSLALSLFLPSLSTHRSPQATRHSSLQAHDAAPIQNETEGEPLLISLSPMLSSPLLSAPASKDENLPAIRKDNGSGGFASREALFGDDEQPKIKSAPSSTLASKDEHLAAMSKDNETGGTTSREALFGEDEQPKKKSVTSSAPAWKTLITGWKGFSQLEIAQTYSDPEHFSKGKLRTELSRTGQFNEYLKWKVSGRFDYDAAYDLSNFYPSAVRDDQRYDFFLRENYLDISAGNFDFRLGRQHVIWGEMVGLFFADVVSAKDMREFILPAFDILRIPQWAVRAEYSKNDFHAEVLWIPVPTIDEIGKPGADFYPGPLRGTAKYLDEDRSGRNIGNSNYGVRLSQLIKGWDVSGFYYHSLDASSTFYRIGVPSPTEQPVFQPRHDQIDQFGATITKDIGSAVFKGELVYTDGRQFNVARPSAANGLVRQNTLEYALGLDFNLPADTRLNVQFFQRVYFGYDPGIFSDRVENGASVLLNGKVWKKLEAQALLIHSLNRSDWMFRPRLSWNFQRNWRWAVGADIFGGAPTGLFGRFDQNDRVYTELRYSF
jgi:hypothetical protein